MGQFVNKYHTLTLNGETYSGNVLSQFCQSQLNNTNTSVWEKDISQFCIDWLSPNDYIETYTSGSTGKPKLIKLQKQHMVASAQKTLQYFGLQKQDTALLPISARYIAGKMMIVRAFVGALNLIAIEPNSNPLLQIKQPVKFAPLVPLQVINALNTINGIWPVDIVIIGGGAIAKSYKEQLYSKQTSFYETYGMTETVSHIALKNIKDNYFSALNNISFTVDHNNCLCIDAPDVTANRIVTNDIVELSSNKSFTFIGRFDNVINSGGVKIIPEKVESKLAKFITTPFVISSIPHQIFGEELVLVHTNSTFTQSQLDDIILNSDLSKYEIPKKMIHLTALPLTDTGKVKRKQLQKILVDVTM